MFKHISHDPPPIRSSLDAGHDPPVVTELVHRPGFWKAYGSQTAICGIAFLLGFFGLVMGIFASDKATSFAQTMIFPSVILEAALAAHAPPDHMSEDYARSLLNVTADDHAEALEAAYRSLRSELHTAHYTHLGSHLAKTLNERLILVDEAYDLLQGTAPAIKTE